MSNWREQAACKGMDTEAFFPLGDSQASQQQERRVKQVCATCPVREQCLEFALTAAIDYGVFGGLNAHERRGMARDPKRNSPAREHEVEQVLDLVDGGLSFVDASRHTRLSSKTCGEIYRAHRKQEVVAR